MRERAAAARDELRASIGAHRAARGHWRKTVDAAAALISALDGGDIGAIVTAYYTAIERANASGWRATTRTGAALAYQRAIRDDYGDAARARASLASVNAPRPATAAYIARITDAEYEAAALRALRVARASSLRFAS